uniref:Uncharacterized protein n=1 Tax=Panagrolaimus sp. ES5 TaxID=591445 RepID=A0AC34GEL4_9BILA
MCVEYLKESDAAELNICPKKLANAMYRRRVTIFIAENDSPKFHEQADNLQKGVIEASEQAVECEKLVRLFKCLP